MKTISIKKLDILASLVILIPFIALGVVIPRAFFALISLIAITVAIMWIIYRIAVILDI